MFGKELFIGHLGLYLTVGGLADVEVIFVSLAFRCWRREKIV